MNNFEDCFPSKGHALLFLLSCSKNGTPGPEQKAGGSLGPLGYVKQAIPVLDWTMGHFALNNNHCVTKSLFICCYCCCCMKLDLMLNYVLSIFLKSLLLVL